MSEPLNSATIRQAIAAAKAHRVSLGSAISNARAPVELDTLYEQNLSALEEHVDRIATLQAELKALLEHQVVVGAEYERLTEEVARLRQEQRTLEVDQRAARLQSDEELRGVRALIHEAHGELQQIRDDIEAEKRRQADVIRNSIQ